jgi:hypothetical protein
MEKAAIKDLIYGGIEEIVQNRRYYYSSSVGRDYSHFTDEGKEAVVEFMSLMAFQVRKAEEEDLEQRAKQQVISALKSSS